MTKNSHRLIKTRFCNNELQSYDPYDIWKTKLGIETRKLFYKNKWLGLIPAGMLTMYDLYINNHLRLGYKKQEYPIVRATAALALMNIYENDNDIDNLKFAKIHIDWLINNSSQGYHGHCWGLGFDWVYSKNSNYDKNTPFSTHTPYPLEALVKYYKLTGEIFLLEPIKSVYHFLERDLRIMKETNETLIISYGTSKDRIVTNSNSYVMYMYALLIEFMPEKKEYIENKIRKIFNFIKSVQYDNGCWLYSPYDNNSFTDCFHSAFVIKNIIKTNKLVQLKDCGTVIDNGYQYILKNFLVKNRFLFKRFSTGSKISLVKFDLYDNAEMLNLAYLVNDTNTSFKLGMAIEKNFINDTDFIGSTIDLFGLVRNKNHLRWAVAPYLYALSIVIN